MKNPFRARRRRQEAARAQARATEPTISQPQKTRLSPDGMQITEFPPQYTSMVRLYGVSGNYAQIYSVQPNVRSAVDLISREAATLSMQVFEDVARGRDLPKASVRLDDHPVNILLNEPSPGMSKFRFWYSLFADIAVYDIAYWIKIRQQGLVRALLRVPPGNLFPVREPLTGRIMFFKTGDGREIRPQDMVVFWGYDPALNHGQISPMETLRRLISEEVAAGMDREGRWRNSARKDGIIERELAAPAMDDVAKEGFLIDVEDTLSGSTGSGRPLMLQPGMHYNDTQWSPREMEYIEARKLSRTEVSAFFHIPPAMLAASIGTGTRSEPDKETLNYFYTSTLPPWLVRVEHEIEAQLLPEFEKTPERRRVVYCEFNLDEKLRGSFEERIAILATAAGGPILRVNEARARENLPPIPGGDLIYVPLNSIRGGGPQASPQSPVETPAGGVEPAGTTPGGGSVQQASAADVMAGNAIVLGAEQAKYALSPDVETVEEILEQADTRYKALRDQEKQLAYLKEQRAKYEALGRQVFLATFERQKNVVVGGNNLKRDRWDRELADDLFRFLYPGVQTIGEDAAKRLGTEFDATRTSKYLHIKAESLSDDVNTKTADNEDFSEGRAEQLGHGLTTWLLGWAVSEALHQSEGNGVKTWHTTNPSSRPTHAALNGTSVHDGQRFGNGAEYPGDATPGPDEVFGCSCLLTAGVN